MQDMTKFHATAVASPVNAFVSVTAAASLYAYQKFIDLVGDGVGFNVYLPPLAEWAGEWMYIRMSVRAASESITVKDKERDGTGLTVTFNATADEVLLFSTGSKVLKVYNSGT